LFSFNDIKKIAKLIIYTTNLKRNFEVFFFNRISDITELDSSKSGNIEKNADSIRLNTVIGILNSIEA
jgi:hypothetical protein